MTDQPPKPRRGCFFYGCITGVVLLVVVLGTLMIGLHYVKKLVNSFTDTKPIALPAVQMSPAEIDKLKQRFEAFQQEVREGHPTKPLALTGDDLNALISSDAEWRSLKGKFYIRLEGDQLKSEVSLPLQELGWKILKGRYLNGNATFNLGFRNGVLSVSPQNVLVKGKPLPESFMQVIREENLAAGLTNQPAAAAVLKGLQDIQVKEGNLVLVPKEQQ